MAKIVGIIVTMLLLNVAMFMFTYDGCEGEDCKLSEYNTEGDSTIWDYFTNPSQEGESSFWSRMFGSAGLLTLITGGGLIVAGAVWLTKDINAAYISLMVFLVGGVIATWIRLWGIVNDSALLGGQSGGVVVMILVGTLIAVQLFNLADWGRGMS